MTTKKRGLGRGLGALIPVEAPTEIPRTADVALAPEGEPADAVTANPESRGDAPRTPNVFRQRPVDVFFNSEGSQRSGRRGSWDAADRDGRIGLARGEHSSEDPPELVPVPGARFAELKITDIRPNPRQPRTNFDETAHAELVNSVRQLGILQPIVVRPAPDSKFELVMGERRWRAAHAAGLERVPAIVRDTDDADLLRDALLENLHRADLNPLEEAAAYRQLLDDFGCTQAELAQRLSRSRPQISNTLRLLKLPPLVQRRVAAGVLSAGHARALLALENGDQVERLAQRIIAEELSVRAVEEIVALGGQPPHPRREPRLSTGDDRTDAVALRLSDRFDTRVRVQVGRKKGRILVEFASLEDLDRILAIMAPT